jgi:predicted nucleotidyltransferase
MRAMTDEGWREDILRLLAENPLADRMRVFGSAAEPGREPKDVDVFVAGVRKVSDLRDLLRDMMALQRRFYGRLDVFVLQGDVLWTRSDDAARWIKARNADALRRAGEAGISLADAIGMIHFRNGPESR